MSKRATRLALVLVLSSFAFAGVRGAEPDEPDGPSAPFDHRGAAPLDRANATAPDPERAIGSKPLPQSLCATITSAAADNGLPIAYFARVIWQESRLQPNALGPMTRSGARAQGIAQFMPATAAERVVLNPFDPADALPKSAAFLRELRARFGNLGLAAAAYNAGPQRVRSWLAGKRPLPSETLTYVHNVTGRPAEQWRTPRASDSDLAFPAGTPCDGETVGVGAASASAAPRAQPRSAAAWVVQLVGDRSERDVLASYDRLRKKHQAILGPYQPVVVATTTRASAAPIWHRVRVMAENRQAAQTLCLRLRAEGGSCLVQHD